MMRSTSMLFMASAASYLEERCPDVAQAVPVVRVSQEPAAPQCPVSQYHAEPYRAVPEPCPVAPGPYRAVLEPVAAQCLDARALEYAAPPYHPWPEQDVPLSHARCLLAPWRVNRPAVLSPPRGCRA